MTEVLCSTGAFLGRINGRNIDIIPQIAEKISPDGFEFMIYDQLYADPKAYARRVNAFGLRFATAHLDKDIGELISRNEGGDVEKALSMFKINCEFAREIGAGLGVLHLWGGIYSDRNIEVNFSVYPKLLEIARENGIVLAIENIPCNQNENPFLRWRELFERFPEGLAFTLDTRFTEFHGLFESLYKMDWLWENKLVRHVHISDYKGGTLEWANLRRALPIGEGQVDFERFFAFLMEKGYGGAVTIESSSMLTGEVVPEILQDNIEYVRKRTGGAV